MRNGSKRKRAQRPHAASDRFEIDPPQPHTNRESIEEKATHAGWRPCRMIRGGTKAPRCMETEREPTGRKPAYGTQTAPLNPT